MLRTKYHPFSLAWVLYPKDQSKSETFDISLELSVLLINEAWFILSKYRCHITWYHTCVLVIYTQAFQDKVAPRTLMLHRPWLEEECLFYSIGFRAFCIYFIVSVEKSVAFCSSFIDCDRKLESMWMWAKSAFSTFTLVELLLAMLQQRKQWLCQLHLP
jgi:hypothetical protein